MTGNALWYFLFDLLHSFHLGVRERALRLLLLALTDSTNKRVRVFCLQLMQFYTSADRDLMWFPLSYGF